MIFSVSNFFLLIPAAVSAFGIPRLTKVRPETALAVSTVYNVTTMDPANYLWPAIDTTAETVEESTPDTSSQSSSRWDSEMPSVITVENVEPRPARTPPLEHADVPLPKDCTEFSFSAAHTIETPFGKSLQTPFGRTVDPPPTAPPMSGSPPVERPQWDPFASFNTEAVQPPPGRGRVWRYSENRRVENAQTARPQSHGRRRAPQPEEPLWDSWNPIITKEPPRRTPGPPTQFMDPNPRRPQWATRPAQRSAQTTARGPPRKGNPTMHPPQSRATSRGASPRPKWSTDNPTSPRHVSPTAPPRQESTPRRSRRSSVQEPAWWDRPPTSFETVPPQPTNTNKKPRTTAKQPMASPFKQALREIEQLISPPPRPKQPSTPRTVSPPIETTSDYDVLPTTIHGGGLKTWSFTDEERVMINLSSQGNPIRAQMELYQGPKMSPQKVEIAMEQGGIHPIRCILQTPGVSKSLLVRNAGPLEDPLQASITGSHDFMEELFQMVMPVACQGGGASLIFEPDDAVPQVRVVLKSEDGNPLHAKVARIKAPHDTVQEEVMVQIENGLCISTLVGTPGFGNKVEVTNLGDLPLLVVIEPF